MSLFDALLLDPAAFHIWISDRKDLLYGSGTVSDPYHGGLKNGSSGPSMFDSIMNLPSVAQANVVIHLGPGIFVTQGFEDNPSGSRWQIRAGMKIIGSGIDVTILRIDNNTVGAGKHVFAIGHPVKDSSQNGTQVDAAEVMDLTIDCNCGTTASAFGGVRLMGNNARVRRVKIINWGSRATSIKAFGIVCLTGDPEGGVFGIDNTGIEDCYALSPNISVASTVATAFAVGHWKYEASAATHNRQPEGKSPCIRNCYINGGADTFVPTPDTPRIIGMSMCWCRGGVLEGNQIYNVDVGGPYLANNSIKDGIVRNCFMKNVGRGPFLEVGQLSGNLNSSSASISVTNNVGTVSGGGLNFATSPLAPGERVVLTTAGAYAGTYLVGSVVGNQFDLATKEANGSIAVSAIRRVLGIGRLIVEGNTIELRSGNTAFSGSLVKDGLSGTVGTPPDYRNGDVIFRGNKVRLVDGISATSTDASVASEIQGAKNANVSNTTNDLWLVLPPAVPQTLRNTRCGNGTYFNNRASSGQLIQGYNMDTGRKYDELETLTEDAFLMAYWDD